MSRKYVTLCLLAFSPTLVRGHGQIHHVLADGVSNDGPNIYYPGDSSNKKTATRVMYKASGPAYVLPSGFNDNSQMSCEGSSGNGAPETLTVRAGSFVDIFWVGATSELLGKDGTGNLTAYNPWVHAMGPIQDYMTSCKGDCTAFDALNAGWTKLAGAGLDMNSAISDGLRATMKAKPEEYYPTSGNGLWAMAKMVESGSRWSIKIPSGLQDGEYILRSEFAAVHSPKGSDPTSGPQLYISCTQLKVINGGNLTLPEGTQAKNLYDPDGEFAYYNVYKNPTRFTLPGPEVWDPDSSGASPATAVNPAKTSTLSPSPTNQSVSSLTFSSTTTSHNGKRRHRKHKEHRRLGDRMRAHRDPRAV